MTPGTRLRIVPTAELTADDLSDLRRLFEAAFTPGEGFDEEDWQHALGGMHFILEEDGAIVSHASVVPRELHVGGRLLRTGYVEAVATEPEHQGRGYGSQVMRAVNAHIDDEYELGALGTGVHAFYERLGWRTWRGPTNVRTASGVERTPGEDGLILVLPTRSSPELDLEAQISCDSRPGDAW